MFYIIFCVCFNFDGEVFYVKICLFVMEVEWIEVVEIKVDEVGEYLCIKIDRIEVCLQGNRQQGMRIFYFQEDVMEIMCFVWNFFSFFILGKSLVEKKNSLIYRGI